MGVAKIKKIEILGLQKDKTELLSLLQKLEAVELIAQAESTTAAGLPAQTSLVQLLEIEEALVYLHTFKAKTGFMEGMFPLRPLVFQEQLKEVIAQFDYPTFLKEVARLRNELKTLSLAKEKLVQERHLLSPWERLTLTLDQVHPTEFCGILLGVLETRNFAQLEEACSRKEINTYCQVVHQDDTNTHLALIYIKEDLEKLGAILKECHFTLITLPRHNQVVRESLLEINAQTLLFDDQIEEVKSKIRELGSESFKLTVVYDYLANEEKIKGVQQQLATQQYTFTLSGWIRAQDVGVLEKAISQMPSSRDTVLFVTEPKDEEVPVALENNRIIQPFEFVTKIYGLPLYHELDPTPFLAPFFFLYVGLCVSDAGYGIVMALTCLWALKKFRMGPQGKRFFKLFLYCGISTIIVGALTGSWFGNLLDIAGEGNIAFLPLKKLKDAMVVLDPLKDPTRLLSIALYLGIIQIWFGNIVAAIGNIKNKRYLDCIFDQASTLILLFGLTGLGLGFLGLLDKSRLALFQWAAFIGACALIATQGRAEKSLGGKLFFGIYYLYNSLSGYLSDILSYSRLWALGLVTGVMANTINLISVQFSAILTSFIPITFLRMILSFIFLILIFVLGHSISFLMNLLGAFVHPVRLQFVEFFSKFFKSGGRPFRAFKVETKYITFG